MSILSELKPPKGARRDRNRVGRGPGSGNGKTCGKGQKGQKARSGTGGRLHFEGGQMPLQRRLPKRGFHNVHGDTVVNVDLAVLEASYEAGDEVTVASLREKRLLKGRFDRVKVLANGSLTKQLTVHAHGFSAGAKAQIEAAGGSAVRVTPAPKAVAADDGTTAAS